MDEERQDVAVACYVSKLWFGQRQDGLLRVLVVGELIAAQRPYETDDGHHADGWPDHFHSLTVYAEYNKQTYPLCIATQAAYRACEQAAIGMLRHHGHLRDEDAEIELTYG